MPDRQRRLRRDGSRQSSGGPENGDDAGRRVWRRRIFGGSARGLAVTRRAFVHRIAAKAPDDVAGFAARVAEGEIKPRDVVAILGKTEGNGNVNDFSRGLATRALSDALTRAGADPSRVCLVMSGGTEGGLSPHFLVFEARAVDEPSKVGALAVG